MNGLDLACVRCDRPIEFRFGVPLDKVTHFYSGAEYVALQDVPVILFCPDCGIEQEVPGHGLTIDTESNMITHLRIDRSDVSVKPTEDD